MEKLIFGCIADDFTGAADAASFLAAGGMSTVLCSGVPDGGFALPAGTDAVVIALKSRTQDTPAAVEDSLSAIGWLEDRGTEHFYVKYCSTFDSTPRGNIGPILDAALEHLHVPASILCPALPANGRTVREGILYVNGVPLAESPMKDHPLTPMWESRITKLMAPQSRYEAMELHGSLIHGNRQTLLEQMAAFSEGRRGCYFVPDYETDQDAVRLAEIFGSWKLLSGGSGLLTALARQLKPGAGKPYPPSGVPGSALILAGSCSVATRAQIRHFLSQGGRALRLEDALLLSGVQTPEALWMEAKGQAGAAPLIYAYETPEGLMEKRNPQGRALSALIEQVLSQVAHLACADGVKRLIVAGGETSGAVTKALGFTAFQIGESIAPGVPILIPLERPDIRLVLKSGNFGQEDFFQRVLDVTKA